MVPCPKCRQALPEAFPNSATLQPCPACATPVMVEIFPAFYAPPAQGSAGEALLGEGESSCYYHPAKRAEIACDGCGRFLCGLCDLDLNGRHLCPTCLQSGQRQGKLTQLENKRVLYDSLALTLAVAPMLVFYFTLATAPATIYVVIRYWNAPRSIIARGRWRLVVAFLLAVLQIAGWIFAIYFVVRALRRGGHH